MLGRRTETSIPTIAERLKPLSVNFDKERKNKEVKRQNVAERYMSRKSLNPLNVGDVVRMQPIQSGNEEWKEGTVTKKLKSRSYEVSSNGKTYRRNRKFLRRSVESRNDQPPLEYNSMPNAFDRTSRSVNNEVHQSSNNNVVCPSNVNENPDPVIPSALSATGSTQTRSGRTVKPPERLNL